MSNVDALRKVRGTDALMFLLHAAADELEYLRQDNIRLRAELSKKAPVVEYNDATLAQIHLLKAVEHQRKVLND